jgi:predicted glycosyltransferase
MKIMQYCQHVLGIGHFFRSMQIAKALSRHEVLFVEGGEPLTGYVAPAHVRRAFLAPLMMDADFNMSETAAGALGVIKDRRRRRLRELFQQFQPDVLLIELFPFGRKSFRGELLPILQLIREKRMATKVICSLRDILVEKQEQAAYEEGVVSMLNDYFHLLLVHSDPRVIALEETFARTGRIQIPVVYTGFVVKPAVPRPPASGDKTVLASSGGGRVGVELLAATIKAVRSLPHEQLHLRVFIGPFMEPAAQALLANLASPDARIGLQPFSLDFASELAAADLSVSMGGYNTCMDVLSTGIRALVYPFRQNREQTLRARRLEALGFLQVLPALDEQGLARRIHAALEQRPAPPRLLPDLRGAAQTALWVESFCKSH